MTPMTHMSASRAHRQHALYNYWEGGLSSRTRFAVGGELSSVKCCENAADGVKAKCLENAADGVKVNTDASSAR